MTGHPAPGMNPVARHPMSIRIPDPMARDPRLDHHPVTRNPVAEPWIYDLLEISGSWLGNGLRVWGERIRSSDTCVVMSNTLGERTGAKHGDTEHQS